MITQNDILILSHLGLGDQIPLNGFVRRTYQEKVFDTMYIIVQKQFHPHLQFMYKDLEKIKFIVTQDFAPVFSYEVQQHVRAFPGRVYNCWWYNYPNITYMDENLYTAVGYNWEDRYNYFKIVRDYEKEQKVYDEIIGNETGPYIFVADDLKRNYKIDPFKISKLDPSTRIIRACELLEYNAFDLLTLIERAEETHCMHSTFFVLIDCMSLNTIYLHNSYLNKIDPIESYGAPMENWLKIRNIAHI